MEKPINRILIIKMRFHGDMLLTTPVISTLKRQYPAAHIDMLLYQDTLPILSENPDIHAFYGVVKKNSGAKDKITNFLSLIKTLRTQRYDLIVNLTDQRMIALLVRLIPAGIKITQDYSHRQSSFWKKSFTHLAPTRGEHVVERNLSVLAPLGIAQLVAQTSMPYRPEHWQTLECQLKRLGVKARYVVIQPTARQLFKCWDNEKFSQVIDALEQQSLSVVLTCGPDEDDLSCVNEIAQGCRITPVTALAGKTQFPELAALIDHAALFIGVDSAPMHIAAAVKTPIVCLFGATDRVYWRPWTENAIQLWAGDYQPMPARKNLDRNKKYLSVIPAGDVIAAAEKLLSQPAARIPEPGEFTL